MEVKIERLEEKCEQMMMLKVKIVDYIFGHFHFSSTEPMLEMD